MWLQSYARIVCLGHCEDNCLGLTWSKLASSSYWATQESKELDGAQGILDREGVQTLSREGKQQLKWMDYYHSRGCNVSLTCRHFDIARQTFYRWKRRYDPKDLSSLEDRSRQPRHVRKPTWRSPTMRCPEPVEGWRCGTCIDGCPKSVIAYAFRPGDNS